MSIPNPAKLQSLEIIAYKDVERSGTPDGTFKAMFNPDTYMMSYANSYSKKQGYNTSSGRSTFIHGKSSRLNLTLVLDHILERRINPASQLSQQTVSEAIKHFLNLCFRMHGETHEPKYLKVQWGDGELSDFSCRIESVNITYSSFDPSGSPLRAELDTTFIEDVAPSIRIRQERKSSPDLTHVRTVSAGDTLPMMCTEIYGSSKHYIRVAQINNLDSFRDLKTGTQLVFPPLDQTKKK